MHHATIDDDGTMTVSFEVVSIHPLHLRYTFINDTNETVDVIHPHRETFAPWSYEVIGAGGIVLSRMPEARNTHSDVGLLAPGATMSYGVDIGSILDRPLEKGEYEIAVYLWHRRQATIRLVVE